MRRAISVFLGAVIAATVPVSFASADNSQIIVQDSSGVPRATSDVEGLGRVDFSVVNAAGQPAENAVVTLTNSTTGEVLTANSALGVATFENVAPGTWVVASTTPGLTFTNVTILAVSTGAAAGTGIALGTVLGVVGAGGAATGLGFAISDATSNGKSHPLSPSS